MMSRMTGARMIARTNVGRTRKKSVSAHQRAVGPAAREPRDDADEGADEDRDERREQADRHRDPGAVDGQVQDVPPELVGPEEVRGGRRLERRAGRGDRRLERPDEQLGAIAMTVKNSRMANPTTPSPRLENRRTNVRAPLRRAAASARPGGSRRPAARPASCS